MKWSESIWRWRTFLRRGSRWRGGTWGCLAPLDFSVREKNLKLYGWGLVKGKRRNGEENRVMCVLWFQSWVGLLYFTFPNNFPRRASKRFQVMFIHIVNLCDLGHAVGNCFFPHDAWDVYVWECNRVLRVYMTERKTRKKEARLDIWKDKHCSTSNRVLFRY